MKFKETLNESKNQPPEIVKKLADKLRSNYVYVNDGKNISWEIQDVFDDNATIEYIVKSSLKMFQPGSWSIGNINLKPTDNFDEIMQAVKKYSNIAKYGDRGYDM